MHRALGGVPEREFAATSVFPVQVVDGREPLVGREQHLATMAAAFASVEGGQPTTLHVHGHSGSGKSTLVDRFLGELRTRPDVVVLAGRCYEQESVPYKALDTLIDALAGYLLARDDTDGDLIPPHVAALARLFPALQRVPAIGGGTDGRDPDERELRRTAFAALRSLLARIGVAITSSGHRRLPMGRCR